MFSTIRRTALASVLLLCMASGAIAAPVEHPWLKPDLSATSVSVKETIPLPPKEEPKEKKFDTSFKIAVGFYGGAVIADHVTTAQALSRCESCYEGNRLFRTKSGGANYALNAAVSSIPLILAVILEKKGHRKWARVLLYVSGSIRIGAAIHNARIKGNR